MTNYTDNDMKETPWCYMPPEMHFESVRDLCDAFWKFQLSRLQDELNNPQMADYFLPPANKFEKVRNKYGKYILLPTAIDNSYVFRGQTKFFDRCLPTLYREKKTEEEILIERLRCCEFEVYLKQLPQVEDFEKRNFSIDYMGLSQHYGLKTDVIDLTNSLDVALFFATCNMSKDGKSFSPQEEDKDYIGYIYAVHTEEMTERDNQLKSLFDGKISAIGMQPFYRPGNQRGFGMHLEKDETLTGLLYSFSYTKEDSKRIFESFQNGNELWHEDEISSTARGIAMAKTFCYEAMNLCMKRYVSGTQKEKKATKHRLEEMGCKFQKHSLWEIGKDVLKEKRDAYDKEGGLAGVMDIVQRQTMSENGLRKNCVDTKFLTAMWMVQFPISGCKAPEGYGSPYGFTESKDGKIWGFSLKKIKQEEQTKPNPNTGKVEKWNGDWRSLEIDYHREKKLKMEVVRVPRKK